MGRYALFLPSLLTLSALLTSPGAIAADISPQTVTSAMRKAATFFATTSYNGGYVYYYSADLETRLGEGPATATG